MSKEMVSTFIEHANSKRYIKNSRREKAQVQAEGKAHEDALKLLKEKPASPKVQ